MKTKLFKGFKSYKDVTSCSFLSEHGYDKLWLEKYKFNISKLGLEKQKAKEWATRSIKVLLEIMKEDLDHAIGLCNRAS